MGERVRRRLVVTGRVQGVFFRDSTRREAQAAGVAGWVRNLGDGGVEAVLEGDQAAVSRLEEYCRRGPGQSRVDRVEATDEPPEGLTGFEVR